MEKTSAIFGQKKASLTCYCAGQTKSVNKPFVVWQVIPQLVWAEISGWSRICATEALSSDQKILVSTSVMPPAICWPQKIWKTWYGPPKGCISHQNVSETGKDAYGNFSISF